MNKKLMEKLGLTEEDLKQADPMELILGNEEELFYQICLLRMGFTEDDIEGLF